MTIDDDELAADWKEIQAKYAVEDDEPAAAGGDGPGETSETSTATPGASDDDQPRDDQGRFIEQPEGAKNGQSQQTQARQPRTAGAAPAQSDAARGGAGGAGAAREGAAGGAPAQAPDAARDISRAPSSWKPGAREGFGQLPESVRAEIHRREADFIRGQQQIAPDAQLGQSMRRAIDPYRMLIEAEGGTPELAVADLLKTAATFRVGTPEQKYNAVAGICRTYGIDPAVLAAGMNGTRPPQQQQQQQFQDPRVDQLLEMRRQEQLQNQQRAQADTEAVVNSWMNESDAQGNPKRPYVNDVINEMAVLVPQIRQANPQLTHAQALEQAYDRATWAHPEIRAILQQQAASASDAQRRADNQTRVAGARRAASVNVPRRAALSSPGKPGSMEETIAATARELGLIST